MIDMADYTQDSSTRRAGRPYIYVKFEFGVSWTSEFDAREASSPNGAYAFHGAMTDARRRSSLLSEQNQHKGSISSQPPVRPSLQLSSIKSSAGMAGIGRRSMPANLGRESIGSMLRRQSLQLSGIVYDKQQITPLQVGIIWGHQATAEAQGSLTPPASAVNGHDNDDASRVSEEGLPWSTPVYEPREFNWSEPSRCSSSQTSPLSFRDSWDQFDAAFSGFFSLPSSQRSSTSHHQSKIDIANDDLSTLATAVLVSVNGLEDQWWSQTSSRESGAPSPPLSDDGSALSPSLRDDAEQRRPSDVNRRGSNSLASLLGNVARGWSPVQEESGIGAGNERRGSGIVMVG